MEVSDILSAIDMVEYIEQYCELEEKSGEYWALSPFKDEKTPSFSVNREKGYWYDFSAGVGGNLVDFVMRYHNVELIPAINMLREYAGISKEQANVITRMAASRIARKYRHSEKALRMPNSVILPPDTMDRYEMRKDKLEIWAKEGISWEAMSHFQVRYDAFSDRIVYPVRDYNGEIISVCGRTCDPDFKTKGIRKYTYFQEIGSIDTIYGYSDNKTSILSRKEIILFEGAKSVLMAYGWGIHNVGALLTSHLSPHQFRFLVKLSSFHGVRIVLAVDADIDVLKDENIQRLLKYARVSWVCNSGNLLDKKDSPVDKGIDTFRTLYMGRRKLS